MCLLEIKAKAFKTMTYVIKKVSKEYNLNAPIHNGKSSVITFLNSWPDNKLLQKKQIDLQNKKKKSSQKKITRFRVLAFKQLLNMTQAKRRP